MLQLDAQILIQTIEIVIYRGTEQVRSYGPPGILEQRAGSGFIFKALVVIIPAEAEGGLRPGRPFKRGRAELYFLLE